jgi:serine/threonine protein kinase
MFEMFDDGTYAYIVTEYLEGKDALDLLQRRKVVPEELAFNIFYQVTLATNYLHRNNFMHRYLTSHVATSSSRTSSTTNRIVL